MEIPTEEGTHELEVELFVYNGVQYELELTVTNTYGEGDKCDHGHDIPSTSDYSRDIELTDAMYGEDFNTRLKDIVILKAIELELYNY